MKTGTYNSLITYLCELEESSPYKLLSFKSLPIGKNGKCRYRADDISAYKDGVRYFSPRKEVLKGGIVVISSGKHKFPIDTIFDKYEVEVEKTIKDFSTQVVFVKHVRLCEGNGWTSKAVNIE